MVLHYPANEKVTLCACSQTAYDFRYTALYFLGYRLKGCTPLVAKRASQYARSLDLSISNKTAIYRGILESVSRHPESVGPVLRSEPPLTVRSALYLRQAQPEEKPREMTTAPGSTVTELGLCGYRLSSYEEMISLIHSFPLFNFPSTRDCITGEQASGGNTLTGLPDHKLSTFSNDSLINVSNLIEDAALEVGSLTPPPVCDMGTSEEAQWIAAAVSTIPGEQFQVAHAYNEPSPSDACTTIPRESAWSIFDRYDWKLVYIFEVQQPLAMSFVK